MKKIKNNRKLILLYIVTLVILVFVNYLFSNYQLLKQTSENRGIIPIKDDVIEYNNFNKENGKLKSNSSKSSITITLNRYVNKFVYKYHSNNDINVTGKINYFNKNGLLKEKRISYTNSNKIDISSEVINKNVNTITLNFNQKNIEISEVKIDNKLNFNIYSYVFLSVLFFDLYLIFFKRKFFSKNIEKGFLLIALTIGGLFILLVPPFIGVAPDDQIHFENVYNISMNKEEKSNKAFKSYSILNYAFINYNTYEERNAAIKKANQEYNNKINEKRTINYVDFKKLNYLPVGIVMKISKALNCPFIVTVLVGRFTYLFIYSFIIYFAIKIIPVHKCLVAFIGLLPSTLFLSSQYSYDNIVNSFMILSISIFIYEMYNRDKKINIKYMILFIFSMFMVCVAKAAYVAFLLLPLLYPKEKFENNKKCKIFKIGLIIIFIAISLTFVLPTVSSPSEVGDTRGGDTSEVRQIELIKKSPVSFIKIFSSNYISNFFHKFFGKRTLTYMGYLGYVKSKNIIYLVLFGLIFFAITDSSNKKYLKIIDRIFIMLLLLFTIALIWGALFLSFTPVGEEIIQGVQGRYFLSLLLPLILCFSTNNIVNNIDKQKYTQLLYVLSIIILFSAIFTNVLLSYCL